MQVFGAKITLWPVLLLTGVLVSSSAIAVNQSKVHFHGSIVASACGLSPEPTAQLVQLGQQPTNLFKVKGDRSPAVPFNIKLIHCHTKIASQAALTFALNKDETGHLFNVKGGATGVGVRILHHGVPLNNGDVATKNSIVEVNNMALFSAAFEANVDPAIVPITSGTADAWVLLRVNYL